MTAHAYTEDQLVEQPAVGLFAELGWQTVSAMEEVFGTAPHPSPLPKGEGVFLGRETSGDVVLAPRLRATLEKLNPQLLPEAIASAVDELTRDRSAMTLAGANREVWTLLKDGVKVSVPDRERGGIKDERVRVVNWENPAANDFLLVSQMTVTGQLYTCRPDLIGFVNWLPWVVIEVKKPGVPARQAFEENLTSYKHPQNGIPQLFWSNAFLIGSNGTDSRVGTITADWERFFEWKRIEREDEPRRVSLEVMLRGTCAPTRLLDIAENFTLFSEHKSGLVKAMAQNHQYLGVNNTIAATLEARKAGHGRGGVFWQTQGSGKSFSMVFFAQKILRKVPGNWTFVVVTDRVELDDQIAKTFKACGAVTEAESKICHAQSGAELRQLLSENHRYVFTLIHKFQTPEVLCDRADVIVLTDEAHRSQYDTLAMNMRAALPRALFLAFTGTPLIAGEEKTRDVFGDYVSIYDFQQSIEDGATVPLYYENRTPELQLVNPDLNDEIYDLIEAAQLDPEQEARLEKELSRQYHLITRDDRLDTVTKDIVRHFTGRGFQGKAMVVSIDKATALRMYGKVHKLWHDERRRVEKDLANMSPANPARAELGARLATLATTDMALVVSPGQNEIEQMRKLGLDIVPHRKRMNEQELDEKFKDPDDPLRLVFLCAMWLTGFDAPSCSTVYLDKPMRNHTLMQTIARANRVFPGKHSGVIVDYANVFASLERALAIYAKGSGGAMPVRDKSELVGELRQAVADATAYCTAHGVHLAGIEGASAENFERAQSMEDAANRLLAPESVKRDFLSWARLVDALYSAVKPDPVAVEFAARCHSIRAIADYIRNRSDPPDISRVMQGIQELLDRSIDAEPFKIAGETAGYASIDLSKIDFDALAKRFEKDRPRNIDLERLKAAVRVQLEQMVRLNRTRADYLEKFQALIAAYNSGSRNIEEIFRDLVALSRTLTEEQGRHVREHLAEEELTVFDILTRPGPELSTQERDEVKKVARQLLAKLHALLILGWRQKVQARAQVRIAIEDVLDAGLPRSYTPELYRSKCSTLFEHVYESYQGDGDSVYAQVA
ncbi:MAG: type I restriction endonuclease subunit R [Pseudomonadota bacterium]|nr:type I restriction endonuclease subunit R [Pseudomonadota bacterium]